MKKAILSLTSIVLFIIVLFIASRVVSIFVIQPIGAIPKGATLIVLRGQKMNFIDSADAVCARTMGGVSLLCRGMALAAIKDNHLFTLPYSETLYLWSTDGARYEN
jgi:hypothetical protein